LWDAIETSIETNGIPHILGVLGNGGVSSTVVRFNHLLARADHLVAIALRFHI
jgi:hypothetical protein